MRSRVSMVTVVDMPIRSGRLSGKGGNRVTFTGMRCTTLTQLPVAFSGGSSEKAEPVPAMMESTRPLNSTPG